MDSGEINRRAGRNLPAAIAVGAGLIIVAVGTLIFFRPGFAILTAVAMVAASVELHRAFRDRIGATSAVVPITLAALAAALGPYLVGAPGGVEPTQVVLVSLALGAIVAMAWRLRRGAKGFVADAGASLFILVYAGLFGSFVTQTLIQPDGAFHVAIFIMCIAGSDTGGYISGVLFGKHKIAPELSPGKTWEGFVGSLLLAGTVGALTFYFWLNTPWWAGVIFGVVMVLAGTSGDLIESAIKRDLGLKDMSNFLPGHGGVLDRLDSIVVGAPVAWLLFELLARHG